MPSFNDELVTDSVSNYAKRTLRLHSQYESQPLASQARVIEKCKLAIIGYCCSGVLFMAYAASNIEPDDNSRIKGGIGALAAFACAVRAKKRTQEHNADILVFETMRQHNPRVVMTMLEGMKDKKFPEQLRQRAPSTQRLG